MQNRDDLPDLKVAQNDNAEETLIAVEYLLEQAETLLAHGNLTKDEADVLDDAIVSLRDLDDWVTHRRNNELIERVDAEVLVDNLSGIHDLSLDVHRTLGDREQAIDAMDGVLRPNPARLAEEQHSSAEDLLSRWETEADEDDEDDDSDSLADLFG